MLSVPCRGWLLLVVMITTLPIPIWRQTGVLVKVICHIAGEVCARNSECICTSKVVCFVLTTALNVVKCMGYVVTLPRIKSWILSVLAVFITVFSVSY